jgi:hydrophobic/amphiphilic exporter-1 (mainly G- bacteria), HAE1 family
MKFFDIIVQNPVKIAVVALLVVLFGTVALTRLPMQLTPEVQTPTLTIETMWPGGSPQEVERVITMEQEEQLKGIEGLIKMSSTSSNSSSRITLEFQIGTNMQEALLKVNSRLQQVREYPIDALRPVISTSDISNRPIAWFNMTSRLPSDEVFNNFKQKYPHHAERVDFALKAHNRGVAMLRLRGYSADHPEFREILPPADRNIGELRRMAEDEIEARFERVKGVAQSEVYGGLIDELQVIVDPEKLAARALTLTHLRDVLLSQNIDTSAGDFWDGKRRWIVRSLGQFRDPQQVENQLLAVVNNSPVYIRDVANVRVGFKKPASVVRRFGESTISVNAHRETGANVLEVMRDLQATAARIDEEILKPMGLQLIQVYDETEYIYSALNLVQQNIFIGGALTVIVLMGFLHFGFRMIAVSILILAAAVGAAYLSPWYFLIALALILGAGLSFARGALVVALAIPISIIATFLVLQLLGRSLNVVSLAGMAFAVGMLVDNAVVVLENIYRHYEMGKTPFEAAIHGSQEVVGAVFSSTVTTVAVFLPIVFVQQEAGQLFRDIALAISSGVLISLVVSVTLIPVVAARLLGNRANDLADDLAVPEPATSAQSSAALKPVTRWRIWLSRAIGGVVYPFKLIGGALYRTVMGLNLWFQGHVWRQFAVITLMTSISLGLSWMFWPKVEYLPSGNQNSITGILLPPPSYNLDQLIQISDYFDKEMRPYWDVDPHSLEAANLKFPVVGDFYFVAGRSIFMGLQAYDPRKASGMVDLLRSIGSNIPGAVMIAKQSSLFEGRMSGGRTVEIEFTGPELEKLVALGGQAMRKIGEIIPNAQSRPVPSLDLSMPEIHINPKLVQAAEMGVSSRDLGYAANALVDGAFAGNYFMDGRKIDITLQGINSFSNSTEKIEALPISTPTGHLVPLSALASVDWASGPEQILRRERSRAITIEVSPPLDYPLEDAINKIQKEIVEPMTKNGQLDGGYAINLAGTADKLTAVKQTFLGKWSGFNLESVISVGTSQFVLVLLVTYLLMAGLFESWLYPLVIILTVPLGMVGGVIGLNLLNVYLASIGESSQQLDVLTMLGFIILIGTVVNNPILIVHQALVFIRTEGATIKDAILRSVKARIRPIFMTTMTTVLGLMPLVLFPGAGSELYRGLGSVVLGGLVVSTVFTLIFVPALFSLIIRSKEWLLGWFKPSRRLVPQATI